VISAVYGENRVVGLLFGVI